jgi:hypothetical protein
LKTSELNFINVLCTAFTCADPKNVKKTVKLSIFFTLSGSKSVKAVHKTLVKLTSVVLTTTTTFTSRKVGRFVLNIVTHRKLMLPRMC